MTATALEAIEAVLAHSAHADIITPLPSSRVSYDEGAAAEALVSAAHRRCEQSLVRRRLQCDQQYVSWSLSLSALSSALRRIATEDVGAVASCLDDAADGRQQTAHCGCRRRHARVVVHCARMRRGNGF